MALSKLAEETLPAYEPDDGPLSVRQLAEIRKAAKLAMPKGKVLARKKLF